MSHSVRNQLAPWWSIGRKHCLHYRGLSSCILCWNKWVFRLFVWVLFERENDDFQNKVCHGIKLKKIIGVTFGGLVNICSISIYGDLLARRISITLLRYILYACTRTTLCSCLFFWFNHCSVCHIFGCKLSDDLC